MPALKKSLKYPVLVLFSFFLVSFTLNTYQQDPVLIAPVAKGKSKFGNSFGERIHPVLGVKKLHSGLDIIAHTGESVLASTDGVVTASYFDNARGNYVEIKYSETLTTSYSHLQVRLVKQGESVKASQIIGNVGKTGLATEPHLHFEVLLKGQAVDPQPLLID
jgi:murein DD-endopeptidase MepM/ murein hydrolase activator NlpD